MPVSASQADANVKTVTAILAREMGIYSNDGSGFRYGDLGPSEQIALTNAVAGYIRQHPALFDTGAADLTNPVNSAPLSQNTQIQDTGLSLGEFVDQAASNARTINPLDPQNIGTVGKYVLAAAVILGLAYIAANYLPAGLAKAKGKA